MATYAEIAAAQRTQFAALYGEHRVQAALDAMPCMLRAPWAYQHASDSFDQHAAVLDALDDRREWMRRFCQEAAFVDAAAGRVTRAFSEECAA
jgi:hypothetical protein